jgi:hypothetical protein
MTAHPCPASGSPSMHLYQWGIPGIAWRAASYPRHGYMGLQVYEGLLPPSSGPTQAGTTPSVAFQAKIGANGKPELEIVLYSHTLWRMVMF